MVISEQRKKEVAMGGLSLKKEGKKYNKIMKKCFSHKHTDSKYLHLLDEQDKKIQTIQRNQFAYYMMNLKKSKSYNMLDTFKLLERSSPNNTISLEMLDDNGTLRMTYGKFNISIFIDILKKKVIVVSELCRLYKHYQTRIINTKITYCYDNVIDGSTASIPYYDAVEFIYNMKIFSPFASAYKKMIHKKQENRSKKEQQEKNKMSAKKITSILSK